MPVGRSAGTWSDPPAAKGGTPLAVRRGHRMPVPHGPGVTRSCNPGPDTGEPVTRRRVSDVQRRRRAAGARSAACRATASAPGRAYRSGKGRGATRAVRRGRRTDPLQNSCRGRAARGPYLRQVYGPRVLHAPGPRYGGNHGPGVLERSHALTLRVPGKSDGMRAVPRLFRRSPPAPIQRRSAAVAGRARPRSWGRCSPGRRRTARRSCTRTNRSARVRRPAGPPSRSARSGCASPEP